MVKNPDEGCKNAVKSVQSRRNNQGAAFGFLDGKRFGNQFAEDNVQEGNETESDTEAQRVEQDGVVGKPSVKAGFKQFGNGRFADPSEPQRSQCDSQLNGA